MPWLSVPFHKLASKDELKEKYGFRTIPTLIVYDGNSGDMVNTNGRHEHATYFKGEYQCLKGCTVL